ncbi:hypothetical protein GGR57DRAFT_263797 [Xylariaceae sp. FL1272]|nr:hypothetical protein GGR57DRAFT_263797 [Xylariaceae sp. FL1272]
MLSGTATAGSQHYAIVHSTGLLGAFRHQCSRLFLLLSLVLFKSAEAFFKMLDFGMCGLSRMCDTSGLAVTAGSDLRELLTW